VGSAQDTHMGIMRASQQLIDENYEKAKKAFAETNEKAHTSMQISQASLQSSVQQRRT